MCETGPAPTTGQTADPAPSGPHRPRMGLQAAGELFLTFGVLLLLYAAWQLWWTNIDAKTRQDGLVQSLSAEFSESGAEHAQGRRPPAAMRKPDYGQPFAIAYIPRFGAHYSVPISAGVGSDVLDSLGLGMYPDSAMPGAVGNFAIAGHRQTYGKALDRIDTLVPGDRIYIRTDDGYYTYVFRSFEIVAPDQTEVLLPVPRHPETVPTERLMTMTSCHPRFSDQQRYVAYSVMESWQPDTAGPPAAIAAAVARK